MKIVHLIASSFFGGPERQMLGLARALPDEVETSFASFSENGRCQAFLNEVEHAGFSAHKLVHDSPHLFKCVREVAEVLRERQADILITHGYKSNLLGRIAARRVSIPIISVSRGWTGENLKVRLYDSLDKFHLRFMDRIVCVSQGQADRVYRTDVAPGRVRVIRNGARLEAFADPDPAYRGLLRELAGGAGPIVLAAGRLSPEKGFHVLVESARLVPSARFILLGDGAERSRLENRVRELGLGERFCLPGFRKDLDALIPWADVVVLPSFTEGLPNVALEASAAGVPVVATAVGGTPEVVEDGVTGHLVPSGDAGALAEKITHLLNNNRLARQFGEAGRQRMIDQFSFQAQAEAYLKLFAELLPAKSQARELAWA